MAKTQIVLNRQSDLFLDNALITNPQGIVLTDISGVSEAVASINEATSVAISSEASDRVVGDLSLASDLSTELVDRAAAVSAEASLRVAGDDSLQGQIDVEVDARASAVSAEASDRVVGDLSLASKLSAEASVRIVAETSLQNNIDAEASTGLVRDNAEASMARAAEQSLATDLLAEQARAESAELSLNTKVEFVISNTSDTALDSLTEIVAAFQSADGDINGAITTLGSAATVAVDNEASIRLAADQSLAGDLSSEIADREAAVSLEEAARIAGDTSVALDLSVEIEARVSDVDAEQARAESAEASLAAAKLDLSGGTMSGILRMGYNNIDNVNTLTLDYIGANSTDYVGFLGLGLDLGENKKVINLAAPTADGDAANKLYVDSADASLAAAVSDEVSARLDAGTSVSAELSSAVSNINDDIETQQSARVAADESLASEIESLAITDDQTIELNSADNTIRLKEYVAAPESGVRTFEGEVDVNSILRVAGVDVMAAMSTEVLRTGTSNLELELDKTHILDIPFFDEGRSFEIKYNTLCVDYQTSYDYTEALFNGPNGILTQLNADVESLYYFNNLQQGSFNKDSFKTYTKKLAALRLFYKVRDEFDAFRMLTIFDGGVATDIGSLKSYNKFLDIIDRIKAVAYSFIVESEFGILLSTRGGDSSPTNTGVQSFSNIDSVLSFIEEDVDIPIFGGYEIGQFLANTYATESNNGMSYFQVEYNSYQSSLVDTINTTIGYLDAVTFTSDSDYETYLSSYKSLNGLLKDLALLNKSFENINSVAAYIGERGSSINLQNFEKFRTSFIITNVDVLVNNLILNSPQYVTSPTTNIIHGLEHLEKSWVQYKNAAKLDLAGGTMSGNVDMGNHNITNIYEVTSDTSITTNSISETAAANYLVPKDTVNISLLGGLDFGNVHPIINLPAPTNGSEAANKTYVDAADASIMTIVNNVISNTSEDALDSLTEIVAAFQSADGDLNGAITALASTGTSGLSAEILRAESAEAVLSADLSTEVSDRIADVDAEESRAIAAEGSISAKLSTELVDRAAAVSAEASDRVVGDLSLANALSTEVSDRIADVDAEESRAIAAEGSLAAILSSEVSRAEAAELSLAEELSSEVSYLISNIDVTQIDSFSEMVGELSSEILRAESAEASLEAAKLDLSGGTMSGDIDMGGGNITELNAVRTDELSNRAGTSGLSFDGDNIAFGGGRFVYLQAPVDGGDAANKTYVDGLSSTLSSNLSAEIERAESAEASLATDFANIYAKHVAVTETPNGSVTSFTLVNSVREGSELIYLNGLTLGAAEMTHYDGWQAVYNFAELIINPLFPEVNNMSWGVLDRGSNISVLMQASYNPANSYGWTEQEFLDKKSNVESLMSTYEMTYRPSNQIDVMGGSYGFIESANGADFVTTEGDYTTTIVNGKVESVTFLEAPSTGDKVRAYGVY